ncbi:MAG TPA: histidine phosphatase family protein, partial [Anaerolineales bacterium]
YLTRNKLPGHYPNIHINERGRNQAAELDQTLNRLPIKAIYASPLERAVETATPLARSLKLKVQLHPGLVDINVGVWTGRSWKVLNRTKNGKIIQETPSQFQFPEGESFIQVQERVVAVLDSITAAHKEELVAVVFHADPIKLAVAHYLGLPLDHFQRLVVFTGSVTVLHINGTSGRLLALNLLPPFSFPDLK